jgi:DNA-binding NarL/FixJ family response regulator
MTSIRVLLVDDQPLVRDGLRRIIDSDKAFIVVGEASDGVEAVQRAAGLRPDVVLMDIRMPVLDGIDATRRILGSQAEVRVVVLTTFGIDEYVVEALRAGASAFLLKESTPERILETLHDVTAGRAVLDPAVTRTVVERLGLRDPSPDVKARLDLLTARELEVFRLVAHGYSNAEISRSLVISSGTTKTHVAHIFTKLQVRDRAQAIVLAHDAGIR